MNFSSLLPKASFALLLLIFGCLVYIIARDRKLDELARARRQAEEDERVAFAARAATVASNDRPRVARDEYAPLRPRSAPKNTQPVRTDPHPPQPKPARGVLAVEDRLISASPAPDAALADYSGFAGNDSSRVASAGSTTTVTGQVILRGVPPAEKQIALDPACGRLHAKPITTRHYVVGDGGTLANVLVYVKTGAVSTGPPIAQSVLLDQVGCEYQPYVTAVQANQALIVRNSDSLLHNVHAMPQFGRERNIAQPVKGRTAQFIFQRPEVFVRFKCDVHPWMFAYVGVVEHHWFAVTGKDGKFSLPPGLSPGRYTLAAAHPKGGELTQDLVITGSAVEPVTFVFEVVEPLAMPGPAAVQAALLK